MTRAVGYGRISKPDKNGLTDSVSLQIQKQDYETWCENTGNENCGWFQDDGISGNATKRPGLDAAFKCCVDLKGVMLITRDVSRITRTIDLAVKLKALFESGDVLELGTTSGQSFGRGYQGEGLLNMQIVMSQMERQAASERMIRRLQRNRELGIPHGGGHRPFGMEADKVTPRAEEVALINEVADHVLAGGSLSSLVKRWQARGLQTVTGKPWKYQNLRAAIVNPRIDKLIDPAKAEMVRLALEERTKQYPATQRVFTRWLNGCLKCGNCGEMLDSHNYDSYPVYGCVRGTGCMKVYVHAERVEDLMAGFVKHVVSPGMRPGESYGDLLAEQKANREALDKLTDLYMDPESKMAKTEYLKRADSLRSAGERIARDLLMVSASAAMAGSVEVWETLDARAKRSVVLDQVGIVTVNKAKQNRNAAGWVTFDLSRFELQTPPLWWKGYLRQLANSCR